MLGAVFGEHKTTWSSSQACCSGVYVRLEDIDSNRITIEPVSGALECPTQEAQARLSQGSCTSARAAEVRGRAG